MEIFKLVGSIVVDTAKAESSIAKTEKSAEGLGKKLASGAKDAVKWAAGLGAAATAVGTAVFNAVSSVAEVGDEIAKGSQRMGITTDQYQELAYAAKRCGVEFGVLERAAKKLEGKDINLDTALNNIMSIEDAAVRTDAAIDLFGESVAYELGPLLNVGGEEFDKMKQRVHDLGGVMSEDATKKSEEFEDAITDLQTAFGGLKNSIASEFMPELTSMIKWITNNAIPVISDFISVAHESLTMPQQYDEGFGYFNPGEEGNFRGQTRSIFDLFPHASGLSTVPYDNYPAVLHRGESVVNAADTAAIMDAIQGGVGSNEPINITIQNVLDGKVIGEYSYQYSRQKARALGV